MEQAGRTVFLDDEVPSAILSIIRDAQKYAMIVTPYVDLVKPDRKWAHAQQALADAVRRGTKVSFFVREDWTQGEEARDELAWLLAAKVEVFVVPNLHAKIYLNETSTLISSMNLTQFSAQSSREFAVLVKAPSDAERLRNYVTKTLKGEARSAPKASAVGSLLQKVAAAVGVGACIRCGTRMTFDRSRPLCDGCYDSWAEYKNEDYKEHFCHRCGKPSKTTYAQPLCTRCYPALAR